MLGFGGALPGPMLSGLGRRRTPPMFNEATDMGNRPPEGSIGLPMPTPAPAPPMDRLVGLLGLGAPNPDVTPLNGIPGASMGAPRRPIGALEQAFSALTPEEQSYQNLQQQGATPTKAGIWNRIKASLVSGALAAQAAGSNPDAAGPAMLAGMIGGGVSRKFGGNMRHNLLDVPRARGLAAESRELADAGLNRRMGFARQYGHDPVSGQPTADTQRQEEDREIRRTQIAGINEDRDFNRTQRDQGARETAASRAVANAARLGVKVPRGAVTGTQMEEFADVVPPRDIKPPAFIPETGGRMMWDPTRGRMVPTPGSEGMPEKPAMTPYQAESLNLRKGEIARGAQKDDEAAEQQARGIADDFEKAKKEVTNLDTKKNQLWEASGKTPNKEGFVFHDGKWQQPADLRAQAQEAETAWKASQAAFEGAKQKAGTHPNLKLNQSGTGIEFRKRAAAAGAASQPQKISVSDPRYKAAVEKYGAQADEWLKKRGITLE